MVYLSKNEFDKIYNENLKSILEPLDIERVQNDKRAKMSFVLLIPTLLVCIPICYFSNFQVSLVLFICSFFVSILMYSNVKEKERKKLKQLVVSKVLQVYGNLYFSDNKNAISHQEIKDMGLFMYSTHKDTDDVIIGIDKGCNFAISEIKLTHTETHGTGKSRTTHTVTDFKGLVVKVQMKKKFSGKTVVGIKGNISKVKGGEKVELEDVDFMRNREIYSTDQIEARYILTPSFMERLALLAEKFQNDTPEGLKINSSPLVNNTAVPAVISSLLNKGWKNLSERITGVSVGFVNGYAYLFIPTSQNFFEISTSDTLLNPAKYYSIYLQLKAILSVIDHLNLDKDLGL